MKLNKKLLQTFAAIWILIFHLWIPVSDSRIEQCLIRIGYVGVDIFFFLSAYSLADKKIEYGKFIRNRFLNVYLKYVFFVLIAAMYKGWGVKKIVKTISCIDLYERGGGAFLWFIPAIMIFYLLYPVFLKLEWKYKAIVAVLLWVMICLFLENVVGYTTCFIFINRIPVIIAGYLAKKYSRAKKLEMLGIPIGLCLLYFWGNNPKLNFPFSDVYYVLAIPLVLGLAGLSLYIKENRFTDILSKATLEIYALQMIFGANLVSKLYRITSMKIGTNLIMLIVFCASAVILNQAGNYFFRKIEIHTLKSQQ